MLVKRFGYRVDLFHRHIRFGQIRNEVQHKLQRSHHVHDCQRVAGEDRRISRAQSWDQEEHQTDKDEKQNLSPTAGGIPNDASGSMILLRSQCGWLQQLRVEGIPAAAMQLELFST